MIDKMGSAWSQLSREEQAALGGPDAKKAYNDEHGIRSEAKDRAQNYSNEHTPNAASEGMNAAEIVAKQETNNAALNNEHSPKANDVGTDAKTPEFNGSNVSSQDEGYASEKRYYGPDGKLYTGKQADDAGWTPGYYDENSGADNYGENGTNSYGNTKYEQKKIDRDESNEAYRQYRSDIGDVRDGRSAGQIVDVSENYKNSNNEMIQKMVDSGQKFTQTEARRAFDGNPDNNLYRGVGGFDAWEDMMDSGFKSQYDQNQYLTSDQAQSNRNRLKEDQSNFMSGEGTKKYGQYDWFQKDLNNPKRFAGSQGLIFS